MPPLLPTHALLRPFSLQVSTSSCTPFHFLIPSIATSTTTRPLSSTASMKADQRIREDKRISMPPITSSHYSSPADTHIHSTDPLSSHPSSHPPTSPSLPSPHSPPLDNPPRLHDLPTPTSQHHRARARTSVQLHGAGVRRTSSTRLQRDQSRGRHQSARSEEDPRH